MDWVSDLHEANQHDGQFLDYLADDVLTALIQKMLETKTERREITRIL